MTEAEIITKVRAIMNEVGNDENLTLLSEDTISLDQYIKSVIADAVNLIVDNSPYRCVNRKSATANVSLVNGAGIIVVPEDYISLIALQLDGWKKIVAKTFELDSEEYKVNANSYTKAGINKPVVFNSYDATGRTLQCYPYASAISLFAYEGRYTPGGSIALNVNDPVAIAICYMCASLVYGIFENDTTSKVMSATAINLLPKK
jgi:hypothetical protein